MQLANTFQSYGVDTSVVGGKISIKLPFVFVQENWALVVVLLQTILVNDQSQLQLNIFKR